MVLIFNPSCDGHVAFIRRPGRDKKESSMMLRWYDRHGDFANFCIVRWPFIGTSMPPPTCYIKLTLSYVEPEPRRWHCLQRYMLSQKKLPSLDYVHETKC